MILNVDLEYEKKCWEGVNLCKHCKMLSINPIGWKKQERKMYYKMGSNPTNSAEFLLLHVLLNLLVNLLIIKILTGVSWQFIVVWICISLKISDVEHLLVFSFACWPSVCLWRKVFFHVHPLRETIWRFFRKTKHRFTPCPAIPLLDIYLKKVKTLVQKDICTPVFIAALLTIAKI